VFNTKIKSFAKQTLGCQCPEEVFDFIDCQRDIELSNQILLTNKINIGNQGYHRRKTGRITLSC